MNDFWEKKHIFPDNGFERGFEFDRDSKSAITVARVLAVYD